MSDDWDFYFANVDDEIASLFVDLGIRDSVPDPEKPWLLWMRLHFLEPRDDGLSSAEEAEVLSQIEDALTEAVGSALEGDLVGRITTNGHRDFYFYAPSFAGFDDTVARAMEPFEQYEWDVDVGNDADWSQYLELLYPSPEDWQCMQNRHVVEQLQRHGDVLEKKRPVSHWAYFADESSREQFVAAVEDRGYIVTGKNTETGTNTDDEPEREHPWGVNFERTDSVDWSSINQITLELLELADANGGDYDGWETSIEKEAD